MACRPIGLEDRPGICLDFLRAGRRQIHHVHHDGFGAACRGMVARVKNWFCAETQTTLLLPPDIPWWECSGKSSSVVVLVLK